jgi:nicotinamidase-related amidase
MRIRREDSAGLVIDIQERLFPVMHGGEAMLERTRILLEGLKTLELPMLVTEQYPRGLGPTLQPVKEFLDPAGPIEKSAFSCCGEPAFLEGLDALKKRFVIICGIEAHVCVLQTVTDLIERGFLPVVVADCTTSRRIYDKDIALERMRQEGARITTSESILFELARVSGNELFRAISKLVK